MGEHNQQKVSGEGIHGSGCGAWPNVCLSIGGECKYNSAHRFGHLLYKQNPKYLATMEAFHGTVIAVKITHKL